MRDLKTSSYCNKLGDLKPGKLQKLTQTQISSLFNLIEGAMSKIKKAVIPAAGFGTRFLPYYSIAKRDDFALWTSLRFS